MCTTAFIGIIGNNNIAGLQAFFSEFVKHALHTKVQGSQK